MKKQSNQKKGLLQNAVFRPKLENFTFKKLAGTILLTAPANFFFCLIFSRPILQQILSLRKKLFCKKFRCPHCAPRARFRAQPPQSGGTWRGDGGGINFYFLISSGMRGVVLQGRGR